MRNLRMFARCSLVTGLLCLSSVLGQETIIDKDLVGSKGCTRFMNRATEYTCPNEAGFQSCVAYAKKGQVTHCLLQGHPEKDIWTGTPEEAKTFLTKLGCKETKPGVFDCQKATSAAAQPVCLEHKNSGAVIDCKNFQAGKAVGNVVSAAANAVSAPTRRIYVFAKVGDALAYRRWDDAQGWKGWVSMGGIILGGPDACSPNPGQISIFVRAADGTMDFNGLDVGDKVVGYGTFGVPYASDPTVVCGTGNRYEFDVFMRGHIDGDRKSVV